MQDNGPEYTVYRQRWSFGGKVAVERTDDLETAKLLADRLAERCSDNFEVRREFPDGSVEYQYIAYGH